MTSPNTFKQLEGILERNLTHYDDGEFGDDHEDMIKITVAEIQALINSAVEEARIDELSRMPTRVMDDPEDDTNIFWYRTYTMPEFEKRIKALKGEK